jgi:hypothetical protein
MVSQTEWERSRLLQRNWNLLFATSSSGVKPLWYEYPGAGGHFAGPFCKILTPAGRRRIWFVHAACTCAWLGPHGDMVCVRTWRPVVTASRCARCLHSLLCGHSTYPWHQPIAHACVLSA